MRFLNRFFNFDASVLSLTDHRKKYYISLSHIFKALFYTTILSINSLLSKDKFLRNNFMRKFIGSKRYLVASDSTLQRNLSNNFSETELENMNIQFFKKLPKHDLIDPVLKRICGIMDGSVFGKFMKEVFIIPGKSDFIFNFNTIAKRGKELPSAELLLQKISKISDKGFFNLILSDGLYYSNNFFKVCLEKLGSHVLVKTQERLNIVKEAEKIINSFPNDIETIKGFDNERQIKYIVHKVNDIKADTINYPLQVAVIEEEYIKRKDKNRYQKFYIITTDLKLTIEQLRYAGHLRWRIENNGFKEMNYLYQTKHMYSKNEQCFTNLLYFIVMAYNLFFCFLKKCDLSKYGLYGKRVFYDWINKIKMSLIIYYLYRLCNSS